MHGVPPVVAQALSDTSLPDTARLMMWHLVARLDYTMFREVYVLSIANEMRRKETTAGQMLTLLVARGYLIESVKRKPRAFRFPLSRIASEERAA